MLWSCRWSHKAVQLHLYRRVACKDWDSIHDDCQIKYFAIITIKGLSCPHQWCELVIHSESCKVVAFKFKSSCFRAGIHINPIIIRAITTLRLLQVLSTQNTLHPRTSDVSAWAPFALSHIFAGIAIPNYPHSLLNSYVDRHVFKEILQLFPIHALLFLDRGQAFRSSFRASAVWFQVSFVRARTCVRIPTLVTLNGIE